VATVPATAVADQFAADCPGNFSLRPGAQSRQQGPAQAVREGLVGVDRLDCRLVGGRIGRMREIGAAGALTHEEYWCAGPRGHKFSVQGYPGPVFPVLTIRKIGAKFSGGGNGFAADQQMTAIGEHVAGQQGGQQAAFQRCRRRPNGPVGADSGVASARGDRPGGGGERVGQHRKGVRGEPVVAVKKQTGIVKK
jgi:hypothetical protein